MPPPEQTIDYRGVAVLVPCLNEAATISKVVSGFAQVLPGCRVYICDNASTDRTAECARDAGAIVCFEPHPGKGGVIRRMFAEIDASIYVIVDGDATYDATRAPELVAAIAHEGFDMVTAVRDNEGEATAYRRGHRAANRLFNWLLGVFFGQRPKDISSSQRGTA